MVLHQSFELAILLGTFRAWSAERQRPASNHPPIARAISLVPPRRLRKMRLDSAAEQPGKNPTWGVDKESVLVLLLRKHRGGHRILDAAIVEFALQIPERTARIKWIEDQVAPLRTVEILNELARRRLDDGGFTSLLDLHKNV
jgi:hypothetical protein